MSNQSKEDELKIELFKKQKGKMMSNLFDLNPSQSEVKLSIVSSQDETAMIVPYRNLKCKKLNCLYDEEELISIANKNGKNATFACQFCKTKISFQDFWLDEDLYEVVSRLFGCYNKSEVAVKDIIIYKQGNYKPIFLKKPGQTFLIDYNMPDLRNYLQEEFFDLKDSFEKKGKPEFATNDIIINRMGQQLSYESLEYLQDELAVSVPLMAFLLGYIKNQQDTLFNARKERGFAIQKKNICLITLLVYGMNSQDKQLDSDYLTNFENFYSTEELVNEYENIAIVLFNEKCWSLLLVDLEDNQSYLYVFKDHMKQEYLNLASLVIAEQLDLHNTPIVTADNFSFHSPNESKFSAALVFKLLLMLIDPPKNPEAFSGLAPEKVNLFKRDTKQIEWLMYKIMQQDEELEGIFERDPTTKSVSKRTYQPDSGEVSVTSINKTPVPMNSSKYDSLGSVDERVETSINEDLDIPEKTKKKKKKKKKHYSDDYEDEDEEIDMKQRNNNNSMPFQQLFEQVKQRYKGQNQIAMDKQDFVELVEKLQFDVAKELQKKRKEEDIQKETLADYYVNSKLHEFNLKVSDKSKKKNLDNDEENDSLTDEQNFEKINLKLNVGELKTVLKQFEKDVHQRIDFKRENGIKDSIDKEREDAEYMESYNTFVHLLHYYYNNDIETYKKLINEYNMRYHNSLFHKLGLDWQHQKQQQQQQQQQQYQPRFSSQLSQPNFGSSKNNNSISNPNSLNSSSVKNMSFLADAGLNSMKRSSGLDQNPRQSLKFNEDILDREQKQIVAQRYNKTISESDMVKLRSGNILTEDALNFFIKYLEERYFHTQYVYQLNQKAFPSHLRVMYLSSNFYSHLTRNKPLQSDQIDLDVLRHYTRIYIGKDSIFDKFAKIIFPVVVGHQEIHLAMINLSKKEVVVFVASKFNKYPKNAVNNPILQNLLRIVQKELYEKKMRNLNFIEWAHKTIYLDEAFVEKPTHSSLTTAYLINMLSKENDFYREPRENLYLFQQRLASLFYKIGVTKNSKHEIIFENLPL